MIVTIDGPAASGKGTLARRIAEHLGLPHLDTGLLYRAVAAALLDAKKQLNDAAAATAVARTLSLEGLDAQRLSGAALGEAASRVAAIPEVRAALLALQQDFASRPGGAVLDAATGTVIAPGRAISSPPAGSARQRRQTLSAARSGHDRCGRIKRDAIRPPAPLGRAGCGCSSPASI
jgi:cytidylate kinase